MTRPTEAEAFAAFKTLLAYVSPVAINAPRVYTSTALPPGCKSKRQFHRRCASIQGARRDGRAWVIDADVYDAAMRVADVAKAAASAPADSVESLLGGVRLKAISGGRK